MSNGAHSTEAETEETEVETEAAEVAAASASSDASASASAASDASVSEAQAEEAHGLTGLPYDAVELRTERLLLRPLTKNDLDDVHAYQKRKDVVRYLMWEVHDHEESAKHLEKRIAMTELADDGDGLIYAVELPDPAGGHGRVIGDMSIFLKSAAHAQLEVGWVFHPAVHGRGYATEAAEAVLAVCFETMRAHRVFAQLDPRNEASARLCERLGMRQEAHLRQSEIFKGEWGDTVIYGMLDTEYAARAR